MPWIIALFVVSLLAALMTLFTITARLIRRDLDERYERLRDRLDREANNIVENLLNDQKPV